MEFTLQRPRFLLFGDSLTERGFGMGGWAASLGHMFYRKVDIVNRGFGGYNTRWARLLLEDVFQGADAGNTKLVTIFFGANDAARLEGPPASAKQHVPASEYVTNLKKIVELVRERGIKDILLVTPPPVHNQGRKDWQLVKANGDAAAVAGLPLDRTNEHTAQYAAACKQVAQDLGLPVVDLYEKMQQVEGWQTRFLCDGLHFTVDGNQYVFDQVVATLKEAFPHIDPDQMPLHFPAWDVLAENLDQAPSTFEFLRKQGPFAVGTLAANATAATKQ